ncbi:hypothetical protein [Microbacterium invictum]|uniref:Uncharacterized protein n=1 Tax=Microbacterium invictum TaxID=515415 RepID=A0AA40VMC8_9MICO|nr:hypothetical protein [Microbacterium invictum]MBB4140296.1 hypothetical protein [Microbacterium invictum]
MALPGWFLVASLAVVALIAVMIGVFGVASARTKNSDDPSPVVKVTLVVAAFWAAISVLAAIVSVLNVLLNESVTITVPVQEFWPQLPAGTEVDGTTATLDGGGFTSAELVATGLSTGARVCWAIGQGLGLLVPGAVAAMIAVTCFQLLAGRAFAPVVARTSMVTAVVVAVGGIAAQLLSDIGGSMAASEVLGHTGGSYEEVAGIEDVFDAWLPQPTFVLELPFWPIAAGLAFAALAAVFRYGSRLQRDTEGLV